ncbi:uncharacterized protein Tco025E_01681 [Trypanosoma conorhini]|uniref:Uncharacterized protein n=1 Tax=Trypanosoma conorhini TaxID=83891 RepID=A0A422Q7V5_9TRYP|nr:uncharacterized protein Tco025E_01681 [Trypanosoma conorhini]RNF26052.1 hypothetical protein Tco025E_01681 [Trypanosoma conorhini]
MAFISSDPYFYDNEIDRMLAEMRARRQQQKHLSKQRQKPAEQRLQARRGAPADLFTSLLERQQSMEAAGRRACSPPKSSLLAEAEEGGPLPRHNVVACTHPRLQEEEKGETRSHPSADISNDESSTEFLRRELRLARNENALLRREMYRTLTTIGRYLAKLDGKESVRPALDLDSGMAEGTAGGSEHDSPLSPLPPATSVWELCDRGELPLSSEEAAVVRDLNGVIASSLQRYASLEKKFSSQGSHILQLEGKQRREEPERYKGIEEDAPNGRTR